MFRKKKKRDEYGRKFGHIHIIAHICIFLGVTFALIRLVTVTVFEFLWKKGEKVFLI